MVVFVLILQCETDWPNKVIARLTMDFHSMRRFGNFISSGPNISSGSVRVDIGSVRTTSPNFAFRQAIDRMRQADEL
jgi:lysozyme family protein